LVTSGRISYHEVLLFSEHDLRCIGVVGAIRFVYSKLILLRDCKRTKH